MLIQTNLQRMRKAAGLTQHELAAEARVSVRSLQYYEQAVLDINRAAAATVYRLALALGCQMEDLLESYLEDDLDDRPDDEI